MDDNTVSAVLYTHSIHAPVVQFSNARAGMSFRTHVGIRQHIMYRNLRIVWYVTSWGHHGDLEFSDEFSSPIILDVRHFKVRHPCLGPGRLHLGTRAGWLCSRICHRFPASVALLPSAPNVLRPNAIDSNRYQICHAIARARLAAPRTTAKCFLEMTDRIPELERAPEQPLMAAVLATACRACVLCMLSLSCCSYGVLNHVRVYDRILDHCDQ